ncbi:MAG: hypothetical protein KGI69_03120 [Patescibacteria group bacterium]|nr:hypothetical protein [Patescibacteria group bacterium]
MTSRPLVVLGLIIIVIAVAAGIGAMATGHGAGQPLPPSPSPASSSTSPDFYQPPSAVGSSPSASPSSSVSPATQAFSAAIPLPASSTADTSSWLIYVDPSHKFSIEYPPGLTMSSSKGILTLAFPKNPYFHWPLLDDARVTVFATSTCPAVTGAQPAAEQLSVGSLPFTRTVGTDVGAGNLYTEVAYDTLGAGVCYRIDFFDHGTNGAGFYVDDASLIQRYDAQHASDMASIYNILGAMVQSFKALSP